MTLPFIKLQGLGNCYIFVEASTVRKYPLPILARKISDPATGVGSDGLIVIDPLREPFPMRIYNRDGTEAEMCGNGLRQAAVYLHTARFPRRKRFQIAPPAGAMNTRIISGSNGAYRVKADLGSPTFDAADMGIKNRTGLAFDVPAYRTGNNWVKADCVSMGNPHAVVMVDNYDFDWLDMARNIGTNKIFIKGTNVHFVQIYNSKRFAMRTYERGSGPTAACGSGAAACLAVGVMRGLLGREAVAEMPGGRLHVSWNMSSNVISQVGPAAIICFGVYHG